MSYPYGAAVSPQVPPDLPYTLLQRRRGDVKATLIKITLNDQPVNISGWTFIFSVTLPSGVENISWTVQSPNTGEPITTVDAPGFNIPPANTTVSVPFMSTTGMTATDLIFITGAGIYSVQAVTDPFTATVLNTGLSGNLSGGSVLAGSTVYQAGQTGMTVLVIPSSITSSPLGKYPCYCKWDTQDPSPGPYKNTFLCGALQLYDQNNPNA